MIGAADADGLNTLGSSSSTARSLLTKRRRSGKKPGTSLLRVAILMRVYLVQPLPSKNV